MNPGLLNLYLRSGDTFNQVLTISNPSPIDPCLAGIPIDLTGCVAEMQIVAQYNVAPVYVLTSSGPTANGGSITLGGTAGTVSISIPPDDTLNLANGSWDLAIKFTDNSIMTFLAGSVFIDSEGPAWT